MKYLPALGFGVLLAILSFTSFDLAANYLLAYIQSVPNLDDNSVLYLGLALHDTVLLFALAGLVFYGYRRFFPRLPNDWFSAVFMQMPLGLAVLSLDGLAFSSLKGLALTLTTLVAATAMLIIFYVLEVRQSKKATKLATS